MDELVLSKIRHSKSYLMTHLQQQLPHRKYLYKCYYMWCHGLMKSKAALKVSYFGSNVCRSLSDQCHNHSVALGYQNVRDL